MDAEVQEVECARALLSDLRELLPVLLARCQRVAKCRSKLLAGSGNEHETLRVKNLLDKAEMERDALRTHILERVEASGEAVAEVRRVVGACVSLDNVALEKPLAVAVPEFCKSIPARRKALLLRLKKLRHTQKIMSDSAAREEKQDDGSHDDSNGLGFDMQLGILNQHMGRLYKLLGKLEQCTHHLSKVKDERYIARYENERATLKNEQALVRTLLQDWIERNEQHGGSAWDLHGETASAMVAALAEDIEDADLTAAMREDIVPLLDTANITSSPRRASRRHSSAKSVKRTAGLQQSFGKSADRDEGGGGGGGGAQIWLEPSKAVPAPRSGAAALSASAKTTKKPSWGPRPRNVAKASSRREPAPGVKGLSIAGLGL
ncbi:Hypothetical Protein FCC1311_059842 [Hondaea fermentalgiana]|uniref:Uncharacterized protein n=1 Tax=Hondaea fermentalgiana TaxID=2315210 RepID=A0A2R5GMA3_9STRA|nr:Hypothetical Protein FCC1311_059842 [Hondaea fermentalgiana]|eukprot:GBG29763.1 Hypothetical Protein FCC1311_059842 [Hondaea fermentalgiana]